MPSSPAINIGIAINNAKKKQLAKILEKAVSQKQEKKEKSQPRSNSK